MHEAVSPLTVEFLTWISSRPRTYAETMEAWRSNCPRHPVWDDAMNEGLVRVITDPGTSNQQIVVLTPKAHALLREQSSG
jgi:hypothetical protein